MINYILNTALFYFHFRVFRSRDFILGETLGEGFFGRAIKVTHRDTQDVMCLKVLNTLDDEAETGFLKEVIYI